MNNIEEFAIRERMVFNLVSNRPRKIFVIERTTEFFGRWYFNYCYAAEETAKDVLANIECGPRTDMLMDLKINYKPWQESTIPQVTRTGWSRLAEGSYYILR